MAPSRTDASMWSGQFTPEQAGTWTLQIANLQGADTACYVEVRFLVTAAPSNTPVIYALIGLMGAAAVGGFAILRRRRATSRPPPG